MTMAASVLGVLLPYVLSPAAADFIDCPPGTPLGDLSNCRLVHELPAVKFWWEKPPCCDPDPILLATILDHNFTIQTEVTHFKDKVTVSQTFPTDFTQALRGMIPNSSTVLQNAQMSK